MTVVTPKREEEKIPPEKMDYRMAEFAELEAVAGPTFSGDERKNFFVPNGSGGFDDLAFTYSLIRPDDGRGAVAADLNNDGFLDLVTRNLHDPKLVVYLQRPTGGHWVGLDFRPQPGFSVPIGLEARVLRPEFGAVALLQSGEGFLSQGAGRLHFGVGRADRVDLEVRWPDGHTQIFSSLPTNRYYQVSRDGSWKPLPLPGAQWVPPGQEIGLPEKFLLISAPVEGQDSTLTPLFEGGNKRFFRSLFLANGGTGEVEELDRLIPQPKGSPKRVPKAKKLTLNSVERQYYIPDPMKPGYLYLCDRRFGLLGKIALPLNPNQKESLAGWLKPPAVRRNKK